MCVNALTYSQSVQSNFSAKLTGRRVSRRRLARENLGRRAERCRSGVRPGVRARSPRRRAAARCKTSHAWPSRRRAREREARLCDVQGRRRPSNPSLHTLGRSQRALARLEKRSCNNEDARFAPAHDTLNAGVGQSDCKFLKLVLKAEGQKPVVAWR